MNFLAPLFLLGALAIAAPVIFHLIRRTTKERMKFGSLMFLEPTPPRLTKKSRIEHWLLLLLRAAALGLLALAFARPFFRTAAQPVNAGAAQNRTVLLLDTSASMRRAGLWDEAKDRAGRAIDAATPDGAVAVMGFDTAPATSLTFDEWTRSAPEARAALARERVAALSPGWKGTNAAVALMAAAELLAEAGSAAGSREIVMVTDAQEGSRLAGLQGYEWPKDVKLRIETVSPRRAGNAGLQLAAGTVSAAKDAGKGVRLRVVNSPDAQAETFQVAWQPGGGGDTSGPVQDVYVPPGQSRMVTLPWPEAGAAAARLVLKGDGDDFDNTVYVTPPPSVTLTALHSGANPEPRGPVFFLEKALPVSRGLTVSLAHHPANAVPPAELTGKAPVWFVTAAVEAKVADAIAAYVQDGGTAFVMADEPGMEQALRTIAAAPAASLTTVTPASGYALLGTIDFNHPLFAAFAEPKFSDFSKIRFWSYCRVDPASFPQAIVPAKFDSGDPALLDLPRGKGRVLVLTGGWHPAKSQLALSSKFPSLLASLIAGTGAGTPQPVQHFAGEPGFDEPGFKSVTVAAADTRVAVNLDPQESLTAPVPPEEFEKLGAPVSRGAKAVPAETPAGESLAAAEEAEGRQKIWRWLLAAVFAVLFIETLLGIRSARLYFAPEGGPTS